MPYRPGPNDRPDRPDRPDRTGHPDPPGPADPRREQRFGALIVEGQRCELWVRSEPDAEGVWHNAILFRRDGKLGPVDSMAGVDWHVPPGPALGRARALDDMERLELFQRAQRPRPPLV